VVGGRERVAVVVGGSKMGVVEVEEGKGRHRWRKGRGVV
jgi:uncharacterized protein YodC (DUF2158 family)